MCLDRKPCEEPTAVGVWWRDDADWKLYDAPHAAAIERGMADGASRVELGHVVSLKYAGGVRYVVDLSTMKQINLASGYTRDVKFVQAPAPAATAPIIAADDDTSIKEELRACQKSIRSLKNMVLRLESDLLAVRSEVSENRAKGVADDVASASHAFNLRCASREVRFGEYWPELYHSEDDY